MKTSITPALILLLALSPLAAAQVSITQASARPATNAASPSATDAEPTTTEKQAAVVEAEVEAEIFDMTIEYQGQSIGFKHQNWQVLPRSVCSKEQSIKARSGCQKIAKDFFLQACRELPASTEESLRYNHKRMYCQAAKAFKPMVAIISHANDAAEDSQKQKCSALIVQALNNSNPYVIARRDRECAKLN